MRAAVITRPGGPEVLEVRDVPRPQPREREMLVRVHASALNRADVMQRQGRYPAPPGVPADIPGMEFAGEVDVVGPGVEQWQTGDRVFGIVGGGGNAEFVVTREDVVARIPRNLSWEEAAAVPEVFITSHDALVTLARMRAGETVLVHAVGSGVGVAAAQLIRALGGRCYGTARSQHKVDRAREFGLLNGVELRDDLAPLGDCVRNWTDGKGVDVVLDLVGGPYVSATIECAAPLARIILIGLLAGRSASLNLGAILSRRLTIRGTTLRGRSAPEKAEATAAFARDVIPLLETGRVRPVVDRVFPLDHIREAHKLMESNSTFGKIVLQI